MNRREQRIQRVKEILLASGINTQLVYGRYYHFKCAGHKVMIEVSNKYISFQYNLVGYRDICFWESLTDFENSANKLEEIVREDIKLYGLPIGNDGKLV
jgi:hypothetical protein